LVPPASNATLQVALLVVSATLLLLVVAIAVRRTYREAANRRRAEREGRLRPMLMRCLAADEPDLAMLDGFAGGDVAVLEALVWNMLSKVRGTARETLTAWLVGRGAVANARRRTRSASAVARARAAEQLGAASARDAVPDVVPLLGDRHAEVRIVAARALGKIGSADAVAPLLRSVDGPRSVPVSLVAMALLHIGPEVVDPLTKALGDRSPGVRAVSAELLGLHGVFAAARWLALLVEHDTSIDVQLAACRALGRIGAPQGVEPLRRAAAERSCAVAVREAALVALGHIGGRDALAALQIALADDDAGVIATAAEALAGAGEAGAAILRAAGSGAPVSALSATIATDWLARMELDVSAHRNRGRREVVR